MNKISLDLLSVVKSIGKEEIDNLEDIISSFSDDEKYEDELSKELERIIKDYSIDPELGVTRLTMYYLGLKHGSEKQ